VVANLNKHLTTLEDDYLYHISLGKNINNLKEMFHDVKFVCMGGSPKRMHQFAIYIKNALGIHLPAGLTLENISEQSDRYAMYKIGPVISVNHGIGCPSMSILLHELIKLVHYAGCQDVTFFRMGTSGGIGIVLIILL
jgi:uridine phosphorylase